MLLRIDDADDGTAETLEACAEAVSELADRGLMAMVEPLPYHREADGSLRLLRDVASLARAVAIASGLGTTSAYTWLKMPSCDDPEAVFAATTLPCVVLGGVPRPDPAEDLRVLGAGAAPSRPCAAWSWAGRCSTRRTARCSRRSTRPPACCARHGELRVSLLRGAADAGAPGRGRRDHARGRRLGLDRAAGAAAGAGRAAARRDRRVRAVRAAAGRLAAGDRRRRRAFELQGRDSVFTRVTDFCYVGRDSVADAACPRPAPRSRCRRRAASGRSRRRTAPAEDVPVEVRGAGPATRQVANFGVPGVWDHADKLICCELLTPDGNWSSYPPHKHDASDPCRVVNEEIYYYRIAGRTGDAVERLRLPHDVHRRRARGGRPGADRRDRRVRDHDVVLVPHGYHGPCVAAPGYEMYYLNVMAGPGAERDAGVLRRPGARLGARHLGEHAHGPPLPDDLGGGPGGASMTESTVRLTTAQALVRWMTAQRSRAARRHRGAAVRRRLRDLRPRQRARPRHRAARGPGRAADLARPERAGHGAGRGGLRAGDRPPPGDGRDQLDRPGRAEHGHRGRRRARQPAAGAAAARRHLRRPGAGPGAAAGRALRRPDD